MLVVVEVVVVDVVLVVSSKSQMPLEFMSEQQVPFTDIFGLLHTLLPIHKLIVTIMDNKKI